MAKIDVFIRDETGGGGSATTIGSSENGTTARASDSMAQPTDGSVSSIKRTKALAVAQMVASGTFQYVTSNVGRYTGDSSKQQAVNNALQAVQLGAMAFVSPTLAITSVAIQGASWALNENWKRAEERVATAQAQARAGYTPGNLRRDK